MIKRLLDKISWELIFFSGIFFLFFLPPLDTDLGWHLRYGDFFWKNGRLLTQNKLTVLLYDYRWPHSYSLYQLLSTLIFRFAKFFGLSFSNGLLMLAIFYLLYLLLDKCVFKTSLVSLLVIFSSLSVFSLGWRAQIFSLLGLCFTFYLLKTQRKFFLFPFLFFFWVNFHGGFVLGLTVVLIYLLIQSIKLLVKKDQFKSLVSAWLYFFLSLMSTLINPYKTKVWWEGWHHLMVPMRKLIAEWTPPVPSVYLLTVIFSIVSLIFFLRKKSKSSWDWLLFVSILPFFYLSLSARRNVPFFFVTASLLIFGSKVAQKWSENVNFVSLSKSLIILIFIFGVVYQLPITILADLNWSNYCQKRKNFSFPCQAVDFIKESKIKGNFYNTYEWGGFLEWRLAESMFFVDGRMPAWPTPLEKSPYTIYLNIIQTQPGWQETLEKYKINYLFITSGNFLDLELSQNPDQYPWQEIYRDKKAVIYEKN